MHHLCDVLFTMKLLQELIALYLTSVEPVNATLFTSICDDKNAPVVPKPGTTLKTPAGNPA